MYRVTAYHRNGAKHHDSVLQRHGQQPMGGAAASRGARRRGRLHQLHHEGGDIGAPSLTEAVRVRGAHLCVAPAPGGGSVDPRCVLRGQQRRLLRPDLRGKRRQRGRLCAEAVRGRRAALSRPRIGSHARELPGAVRHAGRSGVPRSDRARQAAHRRGG